MYCPKCEDIFQDINGTLTCSRRPTVLSRVWCCNKGRDSRSGALCAMRTKPRRVYEVIDRVASASEGRISIAIRL